MDTNTFYNQYTKTCNKRQAEKDTLRDYREFQYALDKAPLAWLAAAVILAMERYPKEYCESTAEFIEEYLSHRQ